MNRLYDNVDDIESDAPFRDESVSGPVRKRDNSSRGQGGIPLSILDNLDTLRRDLMRAIALRRQLHNRRQMVRTSEDFKDKLGRR
jgi:hypothetical protein